MNLLSAQLIEELARSNMKLVAEPTRRDVGERSARDTGHGIEFADHRPYQPGDDLRHLDVHSFTRWGVPYVKQYHPMRPVSVDILVDGSESMNYGEPTKFEFACSLAAGLACIALPASDQVRLHVSDPRGLSSSGRFVGSGRVAPAIAWLEAHKAHGEQSITDALTDVVAQARPGHVIIVASDFMDPKLDLGTLHQGMRSLDPVFVHVLGRDEVDPSFGEGSQRLRDSETGQELHLSIQEDTLSQYRLLLADFKRSIRNFLHGVGGRYVDVVTDRSLYSAFFEDLPQAAIVR